MSLKEFKMKTLADEIAERDAKAKSKTKKEGVKKVEVKKKK